MSGAGGFLAGLRTDLADQLRRAGRARRYERSETVMTEGAPGGVVILVLDGWMKVSTIATDGQPIVLSMVGPGQLIGELAVIGGHDQRRSATVVALSPAETRILTGAEFMQFIDAHGEAGLELARAVAHKLHDSDRKRVEVITQDTTQRLARLLAELADVHGRLTDVGLEVDIALSQEDLAGLVCASREAATRGLATLRARGLISTARRRVVVHDLEALRALAH
jgi:CRP/FNR family cyclic AMP-dependent transcriptional regulator